MMVLLEGLTNWPDLFAMRIELEYSPKQEHGPGLLTLYAGETFTLTYI